MPGSTIIELPNFKQAEMLFELRRARYGYLLALHILVLSASGYTPTQIAAVLFCLRSSVYRVVKAYRAGSFDELAESRREGQYRSSLTPSLRRAGPTNWAPVWKRAKLVARDDDPGRTGELARIRFCVENLGQRAVLLSADELDIHLLPKVGYLGMPKGETLEVLTPGKNEKRYLAALDHLTGRVVSCVGGR